MRSPGPGGAQPPETRHPLWTVDADSSCPRNCWKSAVRGAHHPAEITGATRALPRPPKNTKAGVGGESGRRAVARPGVWSHRRAGPLTRSVGPSVTLSRPGTTKRPASERNHRARLAYLWRQTQSAGGVGTAGPRPICISDISVRLPSRCRTEADAPNGWIRKHLEPAHYLAELAVNLVRFESEL